MSSYSNPFLAVSVHLFIFTVIYSLPYLPLGAVFSHNPLCFPKAKPPHSKKHHGQIAYPKYPFRGVFPKKQAMFSQSLLWIHPLISFVFRSVSPKSAKCRALGKWQPGEGAPKWKERPRPLEKQHSFAHRIHVWYIYLLCYHKNRLV